MSHDVFICHSSKDHTLANAICAKLEANQIRCWLAPRDVVPGMEYAQSIVEAIGATRLTVLVFSQNANQSPHVHRELERTASHGIPILPFRVEDVVPGPSVEYFISDAHWLDALTPPLEKHLDYLAGTVRLILDREAAKTSGQPTPDAPTPDATYTAAAPLDAPSRPHRTTRYAVLAALALIVVVALVVVGVIVLSGDTTSSTSTPALSTTGSTVATTTAPSTTGSTVAATTAPLATGPAIATFTGTQDQVTEPFTVGGPWRLSWTVLTSNDVTPLVVVIDVASGDTMEILDAITEGSGSTVIDQPCSSCTLEITVYGPTTYTFAVTDGA